jgi:hypothetical protein
MTINGDYGPIDERPYIDRILAAVADALTSDEAVDAFMARGELIQRYFMRDRTGNNDSVRVAYHDALEAVGIAKGHGHE